MNKFKYKYHNIKKKLGQHFIRNRIIISQIIDIIQPKLEDQMIEIGPGLGSLTEPLCKILKKLIVIEIDDDLSDYLNNVYYKKKLIIYIQDVLDFNFSAIFKNKLIRIFGNIPYNISTNLIFHVLDFIDIIYDIHFMLQKELFERLVALPGSKKYGILSVIFQYYFDIKAMIYVSAKDFFPIPKIDSVFTRFIPHKSPLINVSCFNTLKKVLFLSFNNRRKILKNSLKSIFSETELLKLGISTTLRAENITIAQYCILSNILFQKNNCKN
ncbi:16S rRNA (adenine(1518)-N(6)/adenine(1519)-N(6))-dimethyltransferase RsmA [Buchnera aphidicola (Neophyllaphis podocarpi)]|uniref:16S rRNA (adenine(1518)-N(6)/adenine(1519)-N(6))- dimethyltransferase RsmA n=1 Tax=Buchnera aphidicola TaxID=9 RepID=UPI0031B7EF47